MKKLRIYLDTSVLGGCFDPEFSEWSNRLMDDFRLGRVVPVLSDVTADEVTSAPPAVRALHVELLAIADDIVPITNEALSLVASYEDHGVLGKRFRNDMLHIALATISEVDVLVSWNFRHIVRLDHIRVFNAVNIELGYKMLAIFSPREVMSHEQE